MSVVHRRARSLDRAKIIELVLILLFGIVIGVYPAIVMATGDLKISLVLLAIPVVAGLLGVKDSPRFLLILLVLSLSLSVRFRPLTGGEFHPGGAEASIAPLDFPLVGLLLLWIAQASIEARKPRLRLTWVDVCFLLFLGAHVLSLLAASDRGSGLLEVARLMKMGLLMLLVRHYVQTRQALKLVLGVVVIAVILQGALAVVQSVSARSLGLGFLGEREEFWVMSRAGFTFGRAGGTMGHANSLANFFEIWTPVALAVWLSRVRSHIRMLAAVAAGAGLAGVFLTFSRAGWVAIIVAIVATIVATGRARAVRPQHIVVVLLVLLLLLCVFAMGAKDLVIGRLTEFRSTSLQIRLATFETALRMLAANPSIGVGANNYLNVSDLYAERSPWVGLRISQALVHNIALLTGAEMGLVGVVSFVLLIAAILWQAIRILRCEDVFLSPVAGGLMAGIIALLAHGMWDWLFRYDPIYTLFWFNVGLLVAIRNIVLTESTDEQDIEA